MNKINHKITKKENNNFVYALDRYTNKNIKVLNIGDEVIKNLKA
jgi:hypothetical protein